MSSSDPIQKMRELILADDFRGAVEHGFASMQAFGGVGSILIMTSLIADICDALTGDRGQPTEVMLEIIDDSTMSPGLRASLRRVLDLASAYLTDRPVDYLKHLTAAYQEPQTAWDTFAAGLQMWANILDGRVSTAVLDMRDQSEPA